MPDYLTSNMPVVVAALVVLALLIVVLLVWRAVSPRVSGKRGQRLGISEYHELDKMRRLVLVRRDNVEHLILIGGPQDVVIERNIETAGPAVGYAPRVAVEPPPLTTTPVAPAPVAPAPVAPPAPIRPAPRQPVFGDRRPPLRPVDPGEPPLSPPGRDPDHR